MTLTLHRALFHLWDTVPIAPHSAPVLSVREQDPAPSTRATRAQRPRRRPNEERRPRPLIVLIVHSVLPMPSSSSTPSRFLTCLLALSIPSTHAAHILHTRRSTARTRTHPRSHMPAHLTSHITRLTSYILHLTSYIVHRTSYIVHLM